MEEQFLIKRTETDSHTETIFSWQKTACLLSDNNFFRANSQNKENYESDHSKSKTCNCILTRSSVKV